MRITHKALHTSVEFVAVCIFTSLPLLLAELHRLYRISFITLRSQDRQTRANQDDFALRIYYQLHFVCEILVIGLELHLSALLVLQE